MLATPALSADAISVRYRSNIDAEVSTTLDRVVVDELARGLPVREFRWYKGRRHYSGWYFSTTTMSMIAYESRLELARIMLADFDLQVNFIAAQPFQLVGADGCRIRRHVPDLLLVDAVQGVTVVDVKAPHKQGDAETVALMDWTERVVALRGWAFQAWYGAPKNLLANVAFLAGYRRESAVEKALIPKVMAVVDHSVSIVDVEMALSPLHSAVVRPVILHLIWRGRLQADLDRLLDGSSLVWRAGLVQVCDE